MPTQHARSGLHAHQQSTSRSVAPLSSQTPTVYYPIWLAALHGITDHKLRTLLLLIQVAPFSICCAAVLFKAFISSVLPV